MFYTGSHNQLEAGHAWAYPTNDIKWVIFKEYKISMLINSASMIDDKGPDFLTPQIVLKTLGWQSI